MANLAERTLGERVAEFRRRRGLSQRDLATEVGRSESWVSQVERDVLPVERVSVLQALADALGASVRDLRPETTEGQSTSDARPDELASLRMAITGHPALATLLGSPANETPNTASLTAAVDESWRLAHASQFSALARVMAPLLVQLERSARETRGQRRIQLARLLARAYQAASAAFAEQDQADAAWLAADRATSWAERAGDPLSVVAGEFRMGYAFVTLRQLDQAEHVASQAIAALAPIAKSSTCAAETLSLYGAIHLLRAVVAAREGDRTATRQAIAKARKIGSRLGADRNDYNTEFGPTNVELHAVSTAIDLGDAGEAIELAKAIDASTLSTERQSRLAIDLGRAHVQRRHIGDAVAALLDAERLAPELVQANGLAREAIRDLLILAGRRPPSELVDLARRMGALT
jgi:transcriptional regulator with XRE-family HTH domain